MVTMKTTFYLTLSDMNDLLLIVHGLMKLGLVIGVLVLVATWPGRSSAAGSVIQQGGLLFAGLVGAATANSYVRTAEACTATGSVSLLDSEPEADSPWPDPVSATHEDRDSDADAFKPMFNIDGAMMMGDFDVNGHPWGVTDSLCDSCDSTTSWSMWDD